MGTHYLLQQEKQSEVSQWKALPYQDALSRSLSAIRGIIGGNRTGKTEWGAKEVYYYLTGTHPFKSITPPVELWIGTPSFDTQLESAQPKLLKFMGDDLLKRCHIEYYQGRKIKTIYTPWGSNVTFKSYEQSVDKWAGAEKRLIWFDEEPPHDIWTEASVRQGRNVQLDIIFTMTPIKGMTWFYDDIWQKAQANGYDIKTPRWEDNPYLTAQQIHQMEIMLSPEELEVRRFGRFVRSVGLVCHWWRRDIHVQDLTLFNPKGGTIWVGIDFGFTTRPTAVVFLCIKDDTLYIFDGIYERGLTTPMLVQRIKEKLGGLYVTGWVADSEAPSDITEINRYGIPVHGVKKESGGQKGNWDEFRARKMMEVGRISAITGKSRLVVASHLLANIDGQEKNWFVSEVEGLFWKTTRTADGTQSRREWGDQPKDSIDAFSYILASLPSVIEEPAKYQNIYQRKAMVPREDDIKGRYDI